MLMIRLSRSGRTNTPHYSVVVTEKSNAAIDGNFLEKLGDYSPTKSTFTFDKDRVQHWISKGAHPSETLARMLHKQGMAGMDRFVDLKKKFQTKSDRTAEAAPTAPAAEAPAAEAAPAA